ncbi:MAG: N-acetyltransferase family protein [bacterium]
MENIVLRREPRESDRDAVRELLGSTGFFSPREIEVAAELIDDRLTKGGSSEYLFIFAEIDRKPGGYICYGPITMTEGRFDLYWIAVHSGMQGRGIGTLLLTEAERHIDSLNGNYLFSETSSRGIYEPTREFYRKQGFREVARVPQFYADHDDKVIFMKRLHGS